MSGDRVLHVTVAAGPERVAAIAGSVVALLGEVCGAPWGVVERSVVCDGDGCGARVVAGEGGEVAVALVVARAQAGRVGWVTDGRRDWCPEHAGAVGVT